MDLDKADRIVRNLKAQDKNYVKALGKGISVNVATNGTRTLYLRARLGVKVTRLPLGVYPHTTIKKAYDLAAKYRASLKSGLNPLVDKMRAENDTRPPSTVKEAVERFVARHVTVKNRARWADEVDRLLRVEVVPKLGKFPLVQLQRSDLAGLVESKAARLLKAGRKGIAANRLAAVLSKWASYCAREGWLPPDLGRGLSKPATETERDRVLTPTEMGALWLELRKACEGRGLVSPVYARVLMMLALTGCRCSEVTGLRMSDIDLVIGQITIRGGKTKASNRTLPLPALARSLIEAQVKGISPENGAALVFPSPRAGVQLPSNEISRAARHIVKSLGQPAWTPHDLRRTLATVLAEADVSGDIARRITGHIPTDVHGKVYDRATRLEDMRKALGVAEAWILEAAQKAGETPENVVALRKAV